MSHIFQNAQNLVVNDSTFNAVGGNQINHYGMHNHFHNADSGNRNVDNSEGSSVQKLIFKPKSSAFFTGQESYLQALQDHFCPGDSDDAGAREYFLLYGMGGIGKTQICLKFTEKMSRHFSHVFWVDASSEETIIQSLRSISAIPEAKSSQVEATSDAVLLWISNLKEKWLMVFDNADGSPEVVEKFLPPGDRGDILVTSRNKALSQITSFENTVEVQEMSTATAIALLLKCSNLDTPSGQYQKEASAIVAELFCLPLAVSQAGAFIQAGLCNIHRYLHRYKRKRNELMSHSSFKGASRYQRTVYGTWELSYQQIKAECMKYPGSPESQAAQSAINILDICAYIHHQNISEEIFSQAAEVAAKISVEHNMKQGLPLAITALDCTLLQVDDDGHWDEHLFYEGIQILHSYSLIKKSTSASVFSIHPLVHAWSRDHIEPAEIALKYNATTALLSTSVQWKFASNDYAFRRLLFIHIQASLEYAAQVGITKSYQDDEYENFALVFRENGDLNKAVQWQTEVLETRKKVLGEEDPATLRSMQMMSWICWHQKRWKEAEKLVIQTLETRKRVLGVEHPDTLTSMYSAVSVYCEQGRWKEAEGLGIQVLKAVKRVLRAEHLDALKSMNSLAITYHGLGRWKESEELGIQVVKICKRVFREEHPETLEGMSSLEATYRTQERWKEAEELGFQVLKICKRVLGPKHQEPLGDMYHLALTSRNQGRWKEAEELGIQVLKTASRVLGPEHSNTLRCMKNLAITYHGLGRWKEAEELGIQVLNTHKRMHGAEHPETLTSMNNLAVTFQKQGRWKEAEKIEIQTLETKEGILGTKCPEKLKAISNLACTLKELVQHQHEEVVEMIELALDAKQNIRK